MDEVDYNKILEELLESRKNRKGLVTSVAPQGYAGSLVSGGCSQGIEPLSFDFASLYPSTMTMSFPGKNSIRKRKIRNIFPDIE
jgi:hypothetical protein